MRPGPLLLVSWFALMPAVASAGGSLQAARSLVEGLRKSGRAEATVQLPGLPSLDGQVRAGRARLALEPPDRARLDVVGTGESVTLRADGGEWLQPATRQLLRLGPGQAAGALRWWRVLLAGGGEGVRERALGGGRWRLSSGGDSVDVALDGRGLPARLDLGDGQIYRLSAWRFLRPRGVAGFRLQPPAGYDSVELP